MSKSRNPIGPAALILLAAMTPLRADEGMWAFDNFPADKVEKTYGFRPDQRWLDHLRLSSLRYGGCSAAFVSPHGLVQTNHHCIGACLRQLSTTAKDLVSSGFHAREQSDEAKCPTGIANQLIDVSNVTERINKATTGKDGGDFAEALKAEEARIKNGCSRDDVNVRCDVVELYNGAIYNLYKYRRYTDVRLVFAPEDSIAFFGGDPDNFEFPRYALDVAFLRVYQDGNPLDSSANYLRYAAADAQPGDLTFTSGHPASTHRLDTVADLAFRRDLALPRTMVREAELRGILTEFSTKGAEQARVAKQLLLRLENDLKANKEKFVALTGPTIIKDRIAFEQALRGKVNADPALRAQYGEAWDNVSAAIDRFREKYDRFIMIYNSQAFQSRLFRHAVALVRHASEVTKPNEARLPGFTDADLPYIRRQVTGSDPISAELDKLTLTFSLTKLREALGPDDAFVRKVLGRKSPAALAAELVDGTSLANPDFRARLFDADQAAIDASSDPMIAFVRTLDPELRAVRKDYEDNVDAPLTKHSGQIARAMFKVYGTSIYPDATFTLRISFGSVAGYRQNGRQIEPVTTIGGLFERATGSEPFELPDSWTAAQPRLNPEQPFNFVTTNDIVGGNSGSPVVNKAGEVVGVLFDGNRQSLGGSFGYDPADNRAVAVNVGAIREALSRVYGADRIVEELAQ